MRHLIAGLGLVVTIALAAGCGIKECADCGECGIAGPTSPGTIDILGPGTDAAGVAAVDLILQEGMCTGEDAIRFRVSYAAGMVSVTSADGLAALDNSKVTSQGEGSTFSDRDLVVSTTDAGTTVTLTFREAGSDLVVSCTGVDRQIACDSM